METKLYNNFNEETIEELGALLRNGSLVAIPTETVYGLGANGLDEAAMSRIYEAKGRPSDNPLILHVPGQAEVVSLVAEISPTAKALMDRFWPGPLTIIMPKSDKVPLRATGGLNSVALRCPNHPVCHAILKAAGVPVAAPSANISGRPSPTTADDVYRDMRGRIEAIADAGPCEVGLESTIVECADDKVVILRPGAITADMLREVVSDVSFDKAMVSPDVAPKAPGMKYKHYAPNAGLITLVGETQALSKALNHILNAKGQVDGHMYPQLEALVTPFEAHEKLGLLLSEEVADVVTPTLETLQIPYHVIVYGEAEDYKSLARILYRSLLEFNDANVSRIFATGVGTEGLGKAIMNRMDKASAHHVVEV